MMKLETKFIEIIPEDLEKEVLYISMEFGTAIHLCPCGCGERVVTPFSPAGWKLIYDGENLTLRPSIENWSSKCKSHYWITDNKIVFAEEWAAGEIKKGRKRDNSLLKRFFNTKKNEKRNKK